jgi:hypothetical protein
MLNILAAENRSLRPSGEAVLEARARSKQAAARASFLSCLQIFFSPSLALSLLLAQQFGPNRNSRKPLKELLANSLEEGRIIFSRGAGLNLKYSAQSYCAHTYTTTWPRDRCSPTERYTRVHEPRRTKSSDDVKAVAKQTQPLTL